MRSEDLCRPQFQTLRGARTAARGSCSARPRFCFDSVRAFAPRRGGRAVPRSQAPNQAATIRTWRHPQLRARAAATRSVRRAGRGHRAEQTAWGRAAGGLTSPAAAASAGKGPTAPSRGAPARPYLRRQRCASERPRRAQTSPAERRRSDIPPSSWCAPGEHPHLTHVGGAARPPGGAAARRPRG